MDNPWANEFGMEAIKVMGLPGILKRQSHPPVDELSDLDGSEEEFWFLGSRTISSTYATAILNQHAMEWLRDKHRLITIQLTSTGQVGIYTSPVVSSGERWTAPTLAEALIQAVLKEKKDA